MYFSTMGLAFQVDSSVNFSTIHIQVTQKETERNTSLLNTRSQFYVLDQWHNNVDIQNIVWQMFDKQMLNAPLWGWDLMIQQSWSRKPT